jgi:outer membrane lipoprotein-sorting protein
MKFVTVVSFVLVAALGCLPAVAQEATSAAKSAPAPSAALEAARQAEAEKAIRGVNAWFNSARTMESDFVQLGPDGRESHGELYVQRPGRLRFEYAPPSNLEIIADGRSLAVRDRKLATQDEYFLSQTPLKFLLKQPFDLARDTKILDVQINPDNIAIRVADSTTFGGTSRIRLIFDPQTYALKQWAVIDPQGYETLVSLYNMDLHAKPDPQLFRIPQPERD